MGDWRLGDWDWELDDEDGMLGGLINFWLWKTFPEKKL